MATELLINIVSQATGKGFLESEKSVKKLQKNVKNLGKAIGVSFAVSTVVNFGKAAVKAFSEDEKAANRLARAVDNLGIGFANPAISKFISDLEKTSAIADDVLRPAFQSLLTTTGSLTKSQELLNNAITISRASGVELATVADDLAKAYIGSNKGLTKYNTGLTKAEIESKSFSEVLGVLLKQSAGAAEDYLSSTAYQMEVLSIAGGNASEIIGGGLVDAFAMIAGGTEASDAAKGIEIVATAVANLARAGGAAVSGIPTILKALKDIPKNIFGGFIGVSTGINLTPPTETKKLSTSEKKQKEALAKLEQAAINRAKQLAALAKKQAQAEIEKTKQKELQAKLDKAALSLGESENVFDEDKIQINAALLAKEEEISKLSAISTEQQKLAIANDLARLTLKQTMLELEDAIAAKDVKAAENAVKKLNLELGILGVLQNQAFTIKNLNDVIDKIQPKNIINLQNLNDALELLAKMAGIAIDPVKLASATGVAPSTITSITPGINGKDDATEALVLAATDATNATTALGAAATKAATDLAIAKIEAAEAALAAAAADKLAAEAAAKSAAADALLASAAATALSESSAAATTTLTTAKTTVEGTTAALTLATHAATTTLTTAKTTVEGTTAALTLATDAATTTLAAANSTILANLDALNAVSILTAQANAAKLESEAAAEGARAAAAAAEAAALAAEAAADYLTITNAIAAGTSAGNVSNNANNITVNVSAGVIGDQETVVTAVKDAILTIENRGDSLEAAGRIK